MTQREQAFLVTLPGGASVVHTGVDWTVHEGALTIWRRVPVVTWTDRGGRQRRSTPRPDDQERLITYARHTWARIEAK